MSYAIPPELQGAPDWQVNADRRFRLALSLAAILVLSGLSLFRLPAAGDVAPLFELVIRLIESAADPVEQAGETSAVRPASEVVQPGEVAEREQMVVPQPVDMDPPARGATPAEPAEIVPVPLEAVGTDRDPFPAPSFEQVEDWRKFGAEIVRDFIANLPKAFTVNPLFDEKRRRAAIKFRASNAPARLEPWDNVEQDQIGRSILRLGNHCFQVLEDPSAVNRDIFESYTQYVVQCTLTFRKKPGEELPWVAEIRAKYPYLLQREAQKRDPNAF